MASRAGAAAPLPPPPAPLRRAAAQRLLGRLPPRGRRRPPHRRPAALAPGALQRAPDHAAAPPVDRQHLAHAGRQPRPLRALLRGPRGDLRLPLLLSSRAEVRRAPGPGALFATLLSALVFTPVAAHNWVLGFSGNQWFLANLSAIGAIALLQRLPARRAAARAGSDRGGGRAGRLLPRHPPGALAGAPGGEPAAAGAARHAAGARARRRRGGGVLHLGVRLAVARPAAGRRRPLRLRVLPLLPRAADDPGSGAGAALGRAGARPRYRGGGGRPPGALRRAPPGAPALAPRPPLRGRQRPRHVDRARPPGRADRALLALCVAAGPVLGGCARHPGPGGLAARAPAPGPPLGGARGLRRGRSGAPPPHLRRRTGAALRLPRPRPAPCAGGPGPPLAGARSGGAAHPHAGDRAARLDAGLLRRGWATCPSIAPASGRSAAPSPPPAPPRRRWATGRPPSRSPAGSSRSAGASIPARVARTAGGGSSCSTRPAPCGVAGSSCRGRAAEPRPILRRAAPPYRWEGYLERGCHGPIEAWVELQGEPELYPLRPSRRGRGAAGRRGGGLPDSRQAG